jgi:hypothetical protein
MVQIAAALPEFGGKVAVVEEVERDGDKGLFETGLRPESGSLHWAE